MRSRSLVAVGILIGVGAFTLPAIAHVTPMPPFSSSISVVTTAELGGTWHPGCPVGAAGLRSLTVRFVGFDNQMHSGAIVVATAVVASVTTVFRTLYAARFPIRSIEPESVFDGSDPTSMSRDNSSGFNCREAVGAPPGTWSVHAFGEAIDINPVENPYLVNGRADPPAGAPYLRRALVRPGMAVPGGTLVRAFAAVGWAWGGRWTASPDYQHFSLTGG